MFRCKTCQKEFPSEKSLDLHLKVHGGMAEYYSTWYPRQDLYDGSFINFKNKKQYLSSFFNSDENRKCFFRDSHGILAKDILTKELKNNQEYKGYSFLPCENYLSLSKLAGISDIKRLFGSCKSFCEEVKIDQPYYSNIPSKFWDNKGLDDLVVHVDTREKFPFKFKTLVYNKLDFGDYTAVGNHYSKTFVDRKSIGDFFSTFGGESNFQRFKREIQRCADFDSFLFVIVEGSIDDLEKFSNKSKFHSGSNFAFHNVRDLLINNHKYVQFLFCQSRVAANDVCKRVLFHGKSLWNCDVQYFLNSHYGLE